MPSINKSIPYKNQIITKRFNLILKKQQIQISLQKRMNKLYGILRKLRNFCFQSSPDYFIKQENRKYTNQQVLHSLHEMITGTRFSQERSIKLLLNHLHCVLFYVCNLEAYNKEVEQFIEKNELGLVMSTIQVLRLYKEYLKKIVPTNSTYFHFLRDSQFYLHYIVVRYVLIVGDSHHLRKVSQASLYTKITPELKTSIFCLLIEWLYELIVYRNSAIYVTNTGIEYLISSTFILVCGLLGRSYENTFTLLQKQKSTQKDTFNKLMFISIYILCDTTSNNKKNKYFLVSMSISCLRKMLVEKNIPDIDIFIPSYFYVDMIGFIHCPLTYEVVLRVLVCFLNEGVERELKRKEKEEKRRLMMEGLNEESNLSHSSESEEPTEQLLFDSPLTEINIWGVIVLIIQKYGTYNKSVLQSFLTKIIPTLPPQSLIRAYCIKIIHQLNLQQANPILSKFYETSGFDYCFDGRLISVEMVIKNFRIFMEAIYSSYVQEAVVEKEVVLTVQNIFKYLVEVGGEEVRKVQEVEEMEKEQGNINEEDEDSVEEQEESEEHQKEAIINSPNRMNKTRQLASLSPSSPLRRTEIIQDQDLIVPSQVLSSKKDPLPTEQQMDPHLKESMFYEKRNSSQIYDAKTLEGFQKQLVLIQPDDEQELQNDQITN